MLFKPQHKRATCYANAYKHATKKSNRAIRCVWHQNGHILAKGKTAEGVTKSTATFHDVTVDITIKCRNMVGKPYTTYWFHGSDDWIYHVETKETAASICREISKLAMIDSYQNLQQITDQVATGMKSDIDTCAFSEHNPGLKFGHYF